MKTNRIISMIVGIILLIWGIYLSIYQSNPHFYSLFAVGLLLILLPIYNSYSKKPLFNKWKFKQYTVFIVLMFVISIVIDKIGLALGYWIYPHFSSLYDEVLKYSFEWVVPLIGFMVVLLLSNLFISKIIKNKVISFVISLVIFVTLAGLATEYVNSFSTSWQVLSMPITNYAINGYFVIWQTIAFWAMAIITLIVYKFTEKKIK